MVGMQNRYHCRYLYFTYCSIDLLLSIVDKLDWWALHTFTLTTVHIFLFLTSIDIDIDWPRTKSRKLFAQSVSRIVDMNKELGIKVTTQTVQKLLGFCDLNTMYQILSFILAFAVGVVVPHGGMIDPPGRNYMYHAGFEGTPPNWNWQAVWCNDVPQAIDVPESTCGI